MPTKNTPPEIGNHFAFQAHPRWLAAGFAALLGVAAIDVLLGPEVQLTIAYSVPLLLFTWSIGRAFGLLLALVACVSWWYYDSGSGRLAEHPQLLAAEWGLTFVALVVLIVALDRLKSALTEAQFASRRDTLTGLVNKSGFYQVVGAELEVCRRYRRTLSIAYIDCDNFKGINDRYGHHVGDDVLRQVARTRSAGTAGR